MKHFSIWLFPSNIFLVWKEHSLNLFDDAIFKDAFFFGNSMQTSISGFVTKTGFGAYCMFILFFDSI